MSVTEVRSFLDKNMQPMFDDFSMSNNSQQSQAQSSGSGFPNTKVDQLNKQINENPHNPDAWRQLIENVEHSHNLTQIRDAFSKLLKHYPNASSAQIRYLSQLLNSKSLSVASEVEDLFHRWLATSPSVDLWKMYLSHVRSSDVTREAREIEQDYEFALTHIGQDKDSGCIWNDYIQFLKAGEAPATWQPHRIDAIRKAYHRAVLIPLENVKQIWQDLQAFETSVNPHTAKKLLSELYPAHLQACMCLHQLKNHISSQSASLCSALPAIDLPSEPTFTQAERELLGKWRNYLKWEEGNPLELGATQNPMLIARIQLAYRKALTRMRFYPEIWYMAYEWHVRVGKVEEGLATLKAGLEALPRSYLLTFAYADAMEEKCLYNVVDCIYNSFLADLRKHLEFLDTQANAKEAAKLSDGHGVDGGVTSALGKSWSQQAQPNHLLNSDRSGQGKATLPELEMHKYEYGLAIIMYLRFARRTEGIKKHRELFARFRKDQHCPWQVYEAAALVEYHNHSGNKFPENIQIATRIFEKGLERFAKEVDYVSRYLEFLISINEDHGARALFEQIIKTIPPEKAKPIWEKWAHYEYQYRDLVSYRHFDRRLAEVFINDHPIKRFSISHSYLGVDPIAHRDLGAAMAAKTPVATANSALVCKAETQTSPTPSEHPVSQPVSGQKRPPSPDYSCSKEDHAIKGNDYSSGHKRPRPMSPSCSRDRSHYDYWDRPQHGRYLHSPPSYGGRNRERDRDTWTTGPLRGREGKREKHALEVPRTLSWFIGELPNPSTFDGPALCIDSFMDLLRRTEIPSSSSYTKLQPLPALPSEAWRIPDYGPHRI